MTLRTIGTVLALVLSSLVLVAGPGAASSPCDVFHLHVEPTSPGTLGVHTCITTCPLTNPCVGGHQTCYISPGNPPLLDC